ncbi:protein rep [Helicobacter heilmannii]|uniref:protein rep n=3 Tax=Helicobacter heilmannii TaxID=35817 RepID=UPI000CF0CC47|nr:protein rep [Helicobacter heilmannii]
MSDSLTQETLEPYQDHKEQAINLDLPTRFADINDIKKSMRACECGDLLAFDKYRNKESGVLALVLAWAIFCKIKWCPMCAWRKAKKILGELLSIFQQIEQDHKVAYVFLTLTTRNAPLSELRALSAHMSVSWRRFIQTKSFRKAVLGYIRAIEYMGDKTPTGQCHLHYHSLLVVPRSYFQGGVYIPQAQWCAMWQKALRINYKPIVDIRGIRPKPKPKLQPTSHTALKNAIYPTNAINPALVSALCEVVKYLVKPTKIAKLDTDQFETLDTQAKGLRQYNLGGLLKEYDPLPPDELDPTLWELLEQEIYKWSGQAYSLERTEKQ